MKKKIIGLIIVIAFIIGIVFSSSLNAGTGKLYTSLTALDLNGVGYGISDPTNHGDYIWHMSTYDSTKGGISATQKNIYCLKGGYGASWESFEKSSPILEYNMFFDLQNERESLSNKIVDNENDADEVVQQLLDEQGTQYREILWLLDNMYIKGETDYNEFLAKAGIFSYEYEGETYYYKIEGEYEVDYPAGAPLTEADIIALQRVAIWTFTNGGEFDRTETDNWLRITTDATTYTLLSDSRNKMATDVYNYLISSAKAGASLYTAENNYTISDAPAEVNINGLKEVDGKYELTTEVIDSNYIIGPIIINQNNDMMYNILLSITDEKGTKINSSEYSFTDSTGKSLGNVKLKDLVGKTDGFYIKVENDLAEKINVQIQIVHYNTIKNLWLQGTETTSQVKMNAEQPLAEISREEKTTTIQFISESKLIEIPVTKVWEDNDNQDGIRPNEVEVILYADGVEIERKAVTGTGNTWTSIFTDLPVKKDGTDIVYTIDEKEVTGYEKTVKGFEITNKHIPETKALEVTKIWDDGNNQDGIRPEYVEIILYADGVKIQRKAVTGIGNTWTEIFANLPVKKSGKAITYTIDETEVTGYEKIVNGYEITNKYIPETKDIEITKIWDDENNQDGIRPNEVEVILYADGVEIERKELTGTGDTWTSIFTDLPLKKNGADIVYTIDETEVQGYEKTINGFEITNKYVPETKDIEITKIWDDENNQDGIRPEYVEIILYADGIEIERKDVTGTGNEWTETFTNLPVKKAEKDVIYTIDETEVTGYDKIVNGFEITNKYIPGTTSVKVTKVWNDRNDKDGLRTDDVTVELIKDGEKYKTVELSDSNNWEYTFTGLPKKENNQNINYWISEITQIEGYTTIIEGRETLTGKVYIITNTHEVPKTFDLALRKYITKINGINIENTRVPNIDEATLKSNTTATYKHRKDPVKVKLGDKVTYSITIYNEGEKGGYATQIIDQLPTGLKYISGSTVQSNKNTYAVTYNENTNQVIFDILTDETEANDIQPYIVGNLDSETIEIECEVAGEQTNKVLTNVAWINEAFDSEEKKVIKVQGDDRDSDSENSPNVNKDNMEDYKGNDLNKDDLTDSTYYYQGEQDDEDFEKTIIIEDEKVFDLALRKYVIKINNNELSSLGQSSRVPNISAELSQEGIITTYKHRKDPVEVEENDIITYAITIYNEGEKAGYARQIIDQLPEGLIYNPSSKVESDKNMYTVTYEISTNKVIFDIVNTEENPAQELKPYIDGKIDSETIEIKCKVIHRAKVGTKNVLTNVAWINEAYDAEENKTISGTGVDIDSEPETKPNVNKDNMEEYVGNVENKNDLGDNTYYYEGQQDDDDFEKVYVKIFDLNLRQFISSINGKEPDISREPVVDVTPLINRTSTTAIYNHPKTPIALKVGDIVIYTIRIYNEGEINGYASEIKDYLPPYLEYLENSELNKKYAWSISEDRRLATTRYLEDKEIKAFNGIELDYKDLQIECKISENAIPNVNITNIAEISEYKYGESLYPEDIDSASYNIDENLPEDEKLPGYKEEQESDAYVPGYEDDDDFEKVYVKEFDLALKKFITRVQDNLVIKRVPKVTIENGAILYEQQKDAMTIHVGDVITYTIRVYNEGEIDGYVSEITDNIPEYLEYLPDNSTNMQYMWKMYDENGNETENIEQAVEVRTRFLSKENSETNLIKAFDGEELSYKDVRVTFKVKDPNSNTHIITNHAQILDDTDEMGNQIKDKDSETNKSNEGEDDQDIENVKVEYFDLSILKFVSKVIVVEDGKETITETGYNGHENPEPLVKVELHKKKLNNIVVKFAYGITITNEGDIPGYAAEIIDYVPQGLKFESSDNPNWEDKGNNVILTKQLENTLLQPGESKTIEVILTWINGKDNMALKTNTAEISEDKNEYDVPDRDSIPNNKQNVEDDIDLANVMLTISTGRSQTYFMLTVALLGVIAIGIALIKKFVI